jgi:hypothetical protein
MPSEEDKRSNHARLLDLQYYFGKDWIDLKVIAEDRRIATWRQKHISEHSPFQCNKCKKYWTRGLNKRNKKIEYLKNRVFKNIPCEKKLCTSCL